MTLLKNIIIMRNKLIERMKQIFGQDQKRIDHALAVLGYADWIRFSEGGDPFIVTAAAIFHDIGITQAELKYNSSAPRYQEIEGPPIARKVLQDYNIEADKIDHICKIIANHHSAKDIDTTEFRIIWDADWLVNIPTEYSDTDTDQLRSIIDKVFKTKKGHQIAVETFLNK